MRGALTLSVAIHGGLLALVLLALAAPRPFAPSREEAVMVDVVTPVEVPQSSASASGPASDARKAAPEEQQGASASPPPASQARPTDQSESSAPAVMPGLLDPAGTLAMYNLRIPTAQFDAKAETQANLTVDEVANFRNRLRGCWRRPDGLGPSSGTRVVIRLALTPEGALAGEPVLIEASAAQDGPLVMRAALQAIRECQPFGFLPRERYSEWKELDVGFSAREMAGG